MGGVSSAESLDSDCVIPVQNIKPQDEYNQNASNQKKIYWI